MKKLKLITSMFLSLIMILSMAVSPVFAEVSYYGDDTITPGGSATDVTVSQAAGLNGKEQTDKFYKVSGKVSSKSYISCTGNLGRSAAVFETAFMLPDTSSKIYTILYYYLTTSGSTNGTDYTSRNFISIGTSGISSRTSSGSALWTLTEVADYEISVNKWYTLAIEFEYASNDNGTIYLNGKKIITFNIAGGTKLYGVRNLYLGGSTADDSFYMDNIHGYKNSDEYTFNLAELTPSEITAYSDGYTLSNNTLTVPYGATVADMLGSINTTDGTDDVIRVYKDSSMTSSAESSDSAKGTMIVVAAKNGTTAEQAYSYYTVEEAEADPDVLKGKSADDISLTENSGNNPSVVSVEPGNYGKLNTDSVYKVTNNISGARVSVVNSLRGNTFAKSKTGVIEFSFCLPENSSGFKTNYSNGYTSDSNVGLYGLTVDNNGIKIGSNHFYTKSIKSNTWYNMAIEISTTGTDEFNIYLNGELIFDGNGGSSTEWYGFRTFFIIPVAANGETLYLDNISHSESFTNTNQAAEISGEKMAARGGKLYALNGASATDITLGTNEALRLYNSDWTLAESLADAEIAVVATTNGRSMERAYTYYDVELSDCVIDYNITTSDDNETLDASVYSNTPASLILALYTTEGSAKTLEGVSSIDAAVDNNGVYAATIPASALNPAYSYTLFAWSDTDNTLTPLTTDISIN